METVDEEFTREAMRFMQESKNEDKPFFLWWNSTRMHIWTRLKAESQGKTGLGIYPDDMVEHDGQVGQLLDKLAEWSTSSCSCAPDRRWRRVARRGERSTRFGWQ